VLYKDVIAALESWCIGIGRTAWYAKNESRHEQELKRVFNEGSKPKQRQDRCGHGNSLHGYSKWKRLLQESSQASASEGGLEVVEPMAVAASNPVCPRSEPAWEPPSFAVNL
jgi:hypothetical protein